MIEENIILAEKNNIADPIIDMMLLETDQFYTNLNTSTEEASSSTNIGFPLYMLGHKNLISMVEILNRQIELSEIRDIHLNRLIQAYDSFVNLVSNDEVLIVNNDLNSAVVKDSKIKLVYFLTIFSILGFVIGSSFSIIKSSRAN